MTSSASTTSILVAKETFVICCKTKLLNHASTSPAGAIEPLNMLCGFITSMVPDNLYLAHRCGFTQKVITGTLLAAGFKSVAVMASPSCFDLWALATKTELAEDELRQLAAEHFPR